MGVVTYDSSVHFYNVSKGQAVAQMLVMADVSDVYAPMSSNLLAKLCDTREELAELLSSIPGMFAGASGPECCATAAIEVIVMVHTVPCSCKSSNPAEASLCCTEGIAVAAEANMLTFQVHHMLVAYHSLQNLFLSHWLINDDNNLLCRPVWSC